MTVDELVTEVYAAPSGPKVGAFFDYDGTVISGYSAMAFYTQRLKDGDVGLGELARTAWMGLRGVSTEREFAELLDVSLAAWAGRTESELAELGEYLFTHEIASRLHTEVWQLVQAHRAMGHTVVLASSATRFQVEPMARALEIEHTLYTPVETREGVVTGRPAGTPLWGVAKARAVRALARQHDIDLSESFGYSNGTEDAPMLNSVGHPVAVDPEDGLRAEAQRREWPVLPCVTRGGTPGVGDTLRTAGFYASFAGAFATGLGVGLLNGSRRQVYEIAGGIAADVGLALTGVDVEVTTGAEHLWSCRPCVFVFNHQSKIDPVILMKLLRTNFTGVAKEETKHIPGFGQLFQLADVAFVRRGNRSQTRQALEPAVAKLRDQGVSLVLAPEGTRSATPQVGRFKKGAFHIAMQAGVPMVPVVLRNTGEVMWRGSQVVHPGTVQVAVHPPIDSSRWRVEDLDAHVDEVRDIFVHSLAHWPGTAAQAPGGGTGVTRRRRSSSGR